MQKPPLSLILSGVFFGYIIYSLYSLSQLFVPPPCDNEETCLKSYLRNNPKLELYLFSSPTSRPNSNEVLPVSYVSPFNYSSTFEMPVNMKIPNRTRNNGTLFLHIFVVPLARGKKSFQQLHRSPDFAYTRIKMTQFVVPRAETFNLLGDKKSNHEENAKKENRTKVQSHLRSRVTFTMMTDDVKLPLYNLPLELAQDIKITQDGVFWPIVKYDFLQTRHTDLVLIDKNVEEMNVTITYTPVSLGKLRLVLHIEAAMEGLKKVGFSDKDVDEAKGIYANTNLYLLAGTVFIASIHLLFDFLAFKNDISFWRGKNSLEGLSTTTIVWRAFSQTIVFLYLLDEHTSLLILIPAGIGTLIELWKTKKILRIEIQRGVGFLPKIKIQSHKSDSAEAKTREFDAESMRYLSYLLYPLVIAGAIYSLLYQPHKSWYSWSINSLVNGVYAFGFLFMLPQLFVNYKLKSVAHLPWRSFMYKAFNTFIDDVFAFIITMPMAHRVACFRDDAVFLVYLYQRWLYPVDKSRRDTATIMEEPSGCSSLPEDSKKNE
ncbi:cleft lip and palate transmembrane protein 1-like protein [Venturia canescens]|uniref:cleft lip and palate transmembrane protein 1-like protein n=1 Tax=Venturia canescens TaxID=32260 RepID=UPI001C9C5D41|nr:cleft lip and palate transmembrane protein 1-like protein [Venturia canescens]